MVYLHRSGGRSCWLPGSRPNTSGANPVPPSYRLSTTDIEGASACQAPNLLTIPQELRDEIFTYILVQELAISLDHDPDFAFDSVKQAFLALSATNKKLRSEAIDMLFQKNTFRWNIFSPLSNIPVQYLSRILQIGLHSSANVCSMKIYFKETQLLVIWYAQKWTVPANGGKITTQPLHVTPSQVSDLEGSWAYRVMQKFQSLIVQGSGMNCEALHFIGKELRGWRR